MKPSRPQIRLGARTNAALLLLLVIAFGTGWLAFSFATAPARWSLVVHAVSGIAIVILLPWKSAVARRGFRRPRPARWASILLTALVLLSLAAGLAHSTGAVLWWGPLSAMEVHVGAALIAVPLVVWHIAARRIRLRPVVPSRRTFLRGSAALVGATAAYGATGLAARRAGPAGAAR